MGAYLKTAFRVVAKDLWPKAEKWLITDGAKALADSGETSSYLSKTLLRYRDAIDLERGPIDAWFENRAKPFLDGTFPKESWYKTLDASQPHSSNYVKSVARETRNLEAAWYNRSKNAGVPVAPELLDYAPRRWDPGTFAGMNLDKARLHLIKSGFAKTVAEADRILEFTKGSAAKKVHTMESPRVVGLKGYREDPSTILEDLHSRVVRAVGAETFGPKNEFLDRILDEVRLREGESAYKFAKFVSHSTLGIEPGQMIGEAERALFSLEAATKLGSAVIGNLSQTLNTVVFAGIRPTAKALLDMMMEHGNFRDFGMRTGALYGHTLTEMRALLGVEANSLGAKVLKGTGFSGVETYNRLIAARAGYYAVKDAFETLLRNPADESAKRMLLTLGVRDPLAAVGRGALTDTELRLAGKLASDITQFRTSVLDLPAGWRKSPFMRMATLYKQFAYNQTRFIKDYVVKPAILHGELRPLIYMTLLFPTFGEVFADAKNLVLRGNLKNRPDSKLLLDRALDNLSYVGGFGIVQDLVYALTMPSEEPTWRFLAGPVFSDAVDAGKTVWPFVTGMTVHKYEKRAAREALRRVPTFGPLLARKAYPPETKSKGIFQRGTVTKAVKRAEHFVESF
jgi:hypothetical protein